MKLPFRASIISNFVMAQAVLPLMAPRQQYSVIKINYPGSGNSTQFVFDALNRCVQIIETTSGINSITNYIWVGSTRAEIRDSSSALLSIYCALGQKNGTASFLTTLDQVASICDITSMAGAVVGQISYDPYGRETTVPVPTSVDHQFSKVFYHSRSKLNLTWFRPYDSVLGRWLTRDPAGESLQTNLFDYVANVPTKNMDQLGLWGYGNWGGWNYTNGGKGQQGESSPFPGSGAAGSSMNGFQPPTSPLDNCFYQHDVCLNRGARIKDPNKRQCWRRNCDDGLLQCAAGVAGSFSSETLAALLAAALAASRPNNNSGTGGTNGNSGYYPGLGPDPTLQ